MKRFLLRIQTYLRKLAGVPVADEMPLPQSDIEKSLYEICKNNPNGIRPGMTPAGSISITENGTYDVAEFAEAEVEVEGRGYELLASGTYTKTNSATAKLEIPAEIQGELRQILIVAPELSDLGETCRWSCYYPGNPETRQYANSYTGILGYHSAGQTALTWAATVYGSSGHVAYSNGIITAEQRDRNYPVQNNTFIWYAWGVREENI